MGRVTTAIFGAAALVAAATALAGGAAPAGSEPPDAPLAAARLLSCDRGPTAGERSARFEGRMEGAGERLAMRFDLRMRRPGGRWRRVQAPTFGVWHRAEPGIREYAYSKRVERLAVPAAYRARVSFRWEDADGRVLRAERRRTRVCRQPDLRPDLAPGAVTITRAPDAGLVRYSVRVRNRGRSPVGASDVAFQPGALPRQVERVPALEPRESARVTFTAPPCRPGEPLVVRVDARREHEERSERNRRRRTCPALS